MHEEECGCRGPRGERFLEAWLLLLLKGSPSHGYQLVERLGQALGGGMFPDPGTVYRNLRSFEPEDPFLENSPTPHLVLPVYMSNKLHGRTYGFELSANWNVTDSWTLKLGYANLTYRLQHDPDSKDPFNLHSDSTSNTPRHQWNLASHLNLSGGWRIDTYLFFVDRLFGMDFLPSYYRLDLSIGWHPTKDVELSLVLQNLLKRDIREFEHPLWERDSIPERAIYGRVTWRL